MPRGKWSLERAAVHPACMDLAHDAQGETLLATRYLNLERPWKRTEKLSSTETHLRERQLRRDWKALKVSGGMVVGVRSYTTMIRALAQRGDIDRTLEVYREMQEEGLEPTDEVHIAIVAMYLKRHRVQDAVAHFKETPHKHRCIAMYNSFLAAHLRGRASAAVFEEVKAGFGEVLPAPDHVTFEALFRFGCADVAVMKKTAVAMEKFPQVAYQTNIVVAQLNGIGGWFRRMQHREAHGTRAKKTSDKKKRQKAKKLKKKHGGDAAEAPANAGGDPAAPRAADAATGVGTDADADAPDEQSGRMLDAQETAAALAYARELFDRALPKEADPQSRSWLANALLEVYRNAERYDLVTDLFLAMPLPRGEVAATLYISACAVEVGCLYREDTAAAAGGLPSTADPATPPPADAEESASTPPAEVDAAAKAVVWAARDAFVAALDAHTPTDDYLWAALMRVYAAAPPPTFRDRALGLFEKFIKQSLSDDSHTVRRYLTAACGGVDGVPASIPAYMSRPKLVRYRRNLQRTAGEWAAQEAEQKMRKAEVAAEAVLAASQGQEDPTPRTGTRTRAREGADARTRSPVSREPQHAAVKHKVEGGGFSEDFKRMLKFL